MNSNNQSSILIPNKNYLLLRKNTDKKDEKLIFSVPYFEELKSPKIAIDNGLAYFTNLDDSLSKEDILGIFCIINSKQFDDYYRMINSTHTINIYELESMYFPSLEIIKEIGLKLKNTKITVERCTEIMEKILSDSYNKKPLI